MVDEENKESKSKFPFFWNSVVLSLGSTLFPGNDICSKHRLLQDGHSLSLSPTKSILAEIASDICELF